MKTLSQVRQSAAPERQNAAERDFAVRPDDYKHELTPEEVVVSIFMDEFAERLTNDFNNICEQLKEAIPPSRHSYVRSCIARYGIVLCCLWESEYGHLEEFIAPAYRERICKWMREQCRLSTKELKERTGLGERQQRNVLTSGNNCSSSAISKMLNAITRDLRANGVKLNFIRDDRQWKETLQQRAEALSKRLNMYKPIVGEDPRTH